MREKETGWWESSQLVRGCKKGGDFNRRKIRKVDREEHIGVREKLDVYWRQSLIHQNQNRKTSDIIQLNQHVAGVTGHMSSVSLSV